MQGNGIYRRLRLFESDDGRKAVSYILNDRKMHLEPVEIVRKCICKLQGKRLCGVCILQRRITEGFVFPKIKYTEALALLKASAKVLELPNANFWGTHAFRRGFADEALKEGGPGALFFSGGWKGIAALGYAEAQSRGALAAAEWLVEHSDSSASENP